MTDDDMTLVKIDAELRPPSEACLRFMEAQGLDPQMPVFRAVVSPMLMAKAKADRPDVANIVQLLVGPFGVISPPGLGDFRVAELQVGDVVLDVEAEYRD